MATNFSLKSTFYCTYKRNSEVQLTTSITETSITNSTRITNEMATSNDYLLKYFNRFLAVLLEYRPFCL